MQGGQGKQSEPQRKARIAIVDDSRFDRELTAEAVDGLGAVSCFETAEDFEATLAHTDYALALLDMVLPGRSGVQVLERLRQEYPDTDVLILTANATVESAVSTLRMGAADYLTKPVRKEQLRRAVEHAMQRRRLRDENQHLRDALRTVEGCRELTRCLEPGEIYPVALDLMLDTLDRTRGIAVFHRAELRRADAVAVRGLDDDESRAFRRVLAEGKPLSLEQISDTVVQTQGEFHDALRAAAVDVGSVLAVPLRGAAEEGGVVWIFDEQRVFDRDELALVRSVQRHAETALENAERYHKAKERAFIDDVTEVYNARYLLSATENEVNRAERYGSELSVLFLDLDRFKLVNDEHGHLVGSQTLRALSRMLLENIRQVDTLARYGGDEFTILLVDTGHEGALTIAERIRKSVESEVFEVLGEASLRLSVSVGAATYPMHGRNRDELLDAADKAMYRAKSMGRNRVCSASEV